MSRYDKIIPVVGVLCLAWLGTGCLQVLDIFGVEAHVTQHSKLTKDEKPKDDRIEDKNPIYLPNLTVVEKYGDNKVTLNKSGSVCKLDVCPFEEGSEKETFDNKLFPTRSQALVALSNIPQADIIPSMEVVNGFMKPFNDGLYAAIEKDLQNGETDSGLQSKRVLLNNLITAMHAHWDNTNGSTQQYLKDALVHVAAALLIGGNSAELPAEILEQAQLRVDAFLLQPAFSFPIGFYTWNETLQEVFRQDRLLQNHGGGVDLDEFGLFAILALVLSEDAQLAAQYQQVIALYAGLTNPFVSYTPLDLAPYLDGWESLTNLAAIRQQFLDSHPAKGSFPIAYFALLPASRTRDTEYFAERYGTTGIPAHVNLIDELIQAIRAGQLELGPAPDSGWYDYQLWSLETLLLPERGPENDHLLLTAAYKEKLIETFKSLITQNRETHVKQAAGFSAVDAGPPQPIKIYPLFQIEPFPTFYLRCARGYRFLTTYLKGILGQTYLDRAGWLDENNERSSDSLLTALHKLTKRLYGFYFLSADSLGLRPEEYLLENEMDEFEVSDCRQEAHTWIARWQNDPEIAKDPRVITPVSWNDGSENSVYWAVVGIRVIKIMTEYVEEYEPVVMECLPHCEVDDMEQHRYFLLVDQMREVRIPNSKAPLTRDEFRHICDQHDQADDIVEALEALR